MKTVFAFSAIILLSACMGGGSGAGGGGASGGGSTPEPDYVISPERSFAENLNGVRSNVGAGAVSFDARLGRAAQLHANDMLAHDYFSHTGRDGSNVGDRASAQGYNWRIIGENIAKGQQSETAVLQAWQNSDGHRANNENPAFEDFGLAKAGSGADTYWVLVLGAEF